MTTVTIRGKTYGLRLDMFALERIESECGGVSNAFQSLQDPSKQVKTTMSLFTALAESAADADPSLCKDATQLRHCRPADFKRLQAALLEEIRTGMKMETEEEAYDGDEYLKEAEKKSEGGSNRAL